MSPSLNSSFTTSWRSHGTPDNIQPTDQPGVYEMVSPDGGEALVAAHVDTTSAPVMTLADEALDASLDILAATAPAEAPSPVTGGTTAPQPAPERSGQTSIPAGWTFTGDITTSDSVVLSCVLDGNVTSENDSADVTLHQSCQSKGRVVGKRIAVHGSHTGSIDAAGGRVSIESTSRITGDVTYSFIQMNGGAHAMQLKYVEA